MSLVQKELSGNTSTFLTGKDAIIAFRFTLHIVTLIDVFGFAGEMLSFTIPKGTEINFT